MPMGKDIFVMFTLITSVILAVSVNWFFGLINFIVYMTYLSGE